MSRSTCTGCGAKLEDGASVCAKCGRDTAMPPETRSGPPATSRRVPVLALAVLGLGVVALVLALVLVRGGSRPSIQVIEIAAPPPVAPAPPVAPVEAPARVAARAPQRSELRVVAAAPATGAGIPASGGTRVHRPTPPIRRVYQCREGAIFGVDPEEALVTIDGKTIGKADDWDDAGGGKKYRFEGPGTYVVRFDLEKYETTWVKIVVKAEAAEKYAEVDLSLKKEKDKEGDKEKDDGENEDGT